MRDLRPGKKAEELPVTPNPAIDPKPKPTSQALSPRPDTLNPHELRTKFRLGGIIGNYIGFWGGTY